MVARIVSVGGKDSTKLFKADHTSTGTCIQGLQTLAYVLGRSLRLRIATSEARTGGLGVQSPPGTNYVRSRNEAAVIDGVDPVLRGASPPDPPVVASLAVNVSCS